MIHRLIVEVLSPSSESYDRDKKFDRYRDVSDFMEYVLVRQELPHIETFFRCEDGGWSVDFASDIAASIQLRSIGVDLKLSDVYAGVLFPSSKRDPFDAPPDDDETEKTRRALHVLNRIFPGEALPDRRRPFH